MILSNLFDEVLVNPVTQQNADSIYIVSGYSTPAMVDRHFRELESLDKLIRIHLIIGMASFDGIYQKNHNLILKLAQRYKNRFKCFYVAQIPPVHSKTYAWYRGSKPIAGFIGSANYTQTAFISNRQEEVLEQLNPIDCRRYYNKILRRSLSCDSPDVKGLIVNSITSNNERAVSIKRVDLKVKASNPMVTLPLTMRDPRNGSIIVHKGAGLNWGQRAGRNPNEAYIPVPAPVARQNFFPPRQTHFTVYTDDGDTLICVIAQQGSKCIETTFSNRILGVYFRRRLNLPLGTYIDIAHLNAYGRTDVDFYKIDAETYYMDFSV